MKPKLIRTENAQYEAQEWSGANESGWAPIGDAVLVLPDVAAETMGKAGLILAPADLQERHSLASESGVVIDMGEGAFVKITGRKPQPGNRIVFERYAGRVISGQDGRTYRMMTADCVAGVEIGEDAAA